MKNKRQTIIIIALAVLIALLATSLVLFLVLRDDAAPPKGGIVYDPNAGEYDPDNPLYNGGNGEVGAVRIPGFKSWTIPPNVTKVTTDFFNPEVNAGKYDMTFEVRVKNSSGDGYEVIYKSGLVKAGDHIQSVTLEHGFEKGEYDAVLHVQPYSADEYQTPLNNANINFKLIVK